MSRWAQILTFSAGFVLAFGGTAVLGYLGQSPWWLWGLFVLFGIWIGQLPALKQLDPKLTTLAAYAFPFLLLWLASNPEPSGTIKTFVFQMVLGVIALAAIVSLIGEISVYGKQPTMRPVFRALVPLFVCCWLVAFFSSSTGAGHHMVDALMKALRMDQDEAQTVVLIFRKSMHFLFYGCFGWFGYRLAIRGGAAKQAVLLGLAVVLMHASFDEIRQSGYGDRTGSFWDVCLDMAGASGFVLSAAALSKRQNLGRPKSKFGSGDAPESSSGV